MFSTVQQEVVESIVPTYLAKGYKFYVCYTHTNLNSGYGSTAEPDLCFIFSKGEITANSGYSYTIPQGSIMLKYRTSNYSSSQYAVNTDRLVQTSYSGRLNINVYEHIYSNATFSESSVIQPDISIKESVNNGYLQANFYVIAAFLLVYCILFSWKIHKQASASGYFVLEFIFYSVLCNGL